MRQVQLIRAMKTDTVVGDIGAKLLLENGVAHELVRMSNAIFLDGNIGPAFVSQAEPAPGTLKHVGDSPEKRAEDEVPEPPKRPYGNAAKSAWIAYAVSVDDKLTEERAEGMTKADLMARYGERLL